MSKTLRHCASTGKAIGMCVSSMTQAHRVGDHELVHRVPDDRPVDALPADVQPAVGAVLPLRDVLPERWNRCCRADTAYLGLVATLAGEQGPYANTRSLAGLAMARTLS